MKQLVEALQQLVELPAEGAELRLRIAKLEEEIRILKEGDPNQLLATEDAAKLIGMTVGALRAAAARGRFPVTRIGRRIRFRREDLLQGGKKRRTRVRIEV